MLLKASFAPALLIAAHCFSRTSWACGLPPRDAGAGGVAATNGSSEPTYPYTDPGDEAPSAPATAGYFINHLCINVRNATESIDWYNRAFGLRLMFTMHVSEHFSISYMGHSHGGRNGTGYQTSEELNRQKNNIEGLIELVHVDAPSWNLPSGLTVPNTFSHIGMVVPDMDATQAHLEAIGANILKNHNDPFVLAGPFADGSGLTATPLSEVSQEERDMIEQVLQPVNKPMILVADPDGTVIEIQPQM